MASAVRPSPNGKPEFPKVKDTIPKSTLMLSQRYQTEQQELAEKIEKLNADLVAQQQSAVDAEKWVNLIKQYVNPSELTAELLNALIEKIVVHEAVKDESNTRTQEIEIYYRFIGKVENANKPFISLSWGNRRNPAGHPAGKKAVAALSSDAGPVGRV